jgi:homogentisate solanesyltransferase
VSDGVFVCLFVCVYLFVLAVSLVTDTTGFTCDYCDLQEVEMLTKMFLDKLTAASINRHPRNISERKINALKNEMMDILQLPTSPATVTASKTAPSTTSPSPAMTPYFSTKTSDILDSFISSCRTTLAMASSVFRSGDAADNFTQRQQDVARYFAMEERVEWAKLVLRKHDVEYNFHCSVRNCGPSCIFAVESCPNVGCCVYFSRKWAEAHDAVCPEKILGCPRTCGECLQRKRMDMHLRDDCILRPITCTYHSVGCKHGKSPAPPPLPPPPLPPPLRRRRLCKRRERKKTDSLLCVVCCVLCV